MDMDTNYIDTGVHVHATVMDKPWTWTRRETGVHLTLIGRIRDFFEIGKLVSISLIFNHLKWNPC